MVLCNVILRRINMLNLLKNVRVSQGVSFKNISGILCDRIPGIIPIQGSKYYSKITSEESNLKSGETSETQTSKRIFASPRITVISKDSGLTVMTLEEARKLSKRRDLKLVKILDLDHKTQRPVYQLMTGAEYFQEDLNHRKEKSLKKSSEAKDPKLLTLSTKISSHDLESKLKNIVKWLNKRHEVRIVITAGENDEAAETICQTIEARTKSCGKMVQKRKKGDNVKFQLMPLKKNDSDSSEKVAKDNEPKAVNTNEES